MSFTLGISLGIGSGSVGPPAGSGGGGGDNPPITEELQLYINPEADVYSDAGTTLAVNGDYIRQINDQSGNSNILEQATASAQFQYTTDILGTGNAGFYKNGSADIMNFNTPVIINGAIQSLTFYAVYSRTTNGNVSYLLTLPDNNYNRILQYQSTIYIQDEDADSIFAGSTKVLNQVVIKAYVLNTSTNVMTTYLDGQQENTVTLAKTWADFSFSSFFGGGFGGYIGNVMLYSDAHDATQVEEVSDWLNEKYKIYNQPLPITDNLEVYYNPDVDVYSDAIGTPAVDGDYVRQMDDQSDNSNTASQSSASVQPIYNTSELGNGNASLFTGSNDGLEFSSSIVIPDASSWAFYTVYKKDVLGDYSAAIGNRVYPTFAHINFRASYVRATDDGNQYNWNSFSDDTTLKIMTVVVDSSANTISVYKNGSLAVSNSITYSDDFTFKSLFYHTGIPGTNTYWGNVLLYSDLHDATQVGEVSNWLNQKYKIY